MEQKASTNLGVILGSSLLLTPHVVFISKSSLYLQNISESKHFSLFTLWAQQQSCWSLNLSPLPPLPLCPPGSSHPSNLRYQWISSCYSLLCARSCSGPQVRVKARIFPVTCKILPSEVYPHRPPVASPLLHLLAHSRLLAVSWKHWALSYLRAMAFAGPSAWNVLLPEILEIHFQLLSLRICLNVIFSLRLHWAAYLKLQLLSPVFPIPRLFSLKRLSPFNIWYHHYYWLSVAFH